MTACRPAHTDHHHICCDHEPKSWHRALSGIGAEPAHIDLFEVRKVATVGPIV